MESGLEGGCLKKAAEVRKSEMKRFIYFSSGIFLLCLMACTVRETQPPPVVEPLPRPAKIALVLGAGASKGFAHVGVLKVLETNKVPVHLIVGTSVGSVVGSFYAYGLSGFDLQRLSFTIEQKDIVDLVLPENGFIRGDKLEEFVNRTVKHTPMERLKIPFYAVATEIQSGQETVFGKGNTGQAVRASCAIPGVFRPVKIGERFYVDGGVVSPVAVEAARRLGADVVIAVDISASSERTPPTHTIETLLQSITIMYSKLAAIQLSQADVVIRPKVGYIGSADFSKRHEAILEGEKAATEALPKILEILNRLRIERRLE
ncbi:MAG: patatin-like phospholipase family protein [Desulfobacterota bacterium]|nr:patatin-like phospholipase family protein [Thermodesulfobacteriota bacterium]